eukprot:scaffold238563_cov31-Tisochrysis_lutea.AAC.2
MLPHGQPCEVRRPWKEVGAPSNGIPRIPGNLGKRVGLEEPVTHRPTARVPVLAPNIEGEHHEMDEKSTRKGH